MKKILAVVLSIVLSFTLFSCGKPNGKDKDAAENSGQNSAFDDMSMLYCRADSFDPYTASSDINRQLCKLLYEPLMTYDSEFNAVYRLADSAEVGDKILTVVLKSAAFSDGSAVTANDVIYSFNKARAALGSYYHKLYEVVKLEAIDDTTLLFTLSRNDPYIRNLLDFPIIKAESDKITDSDGVLQPPIGCGRYVLSKDKASLILNEGFFGKKGSIKNISLIDTPDSDAVSHYVEVGAVSFYYADLSNGEVVRMSAKKEDVNLNNFVYIGINSAFPDLQNKYIRYAISSALDRDAVCANAYHNNATPASGFFNPDFKEVSSVQSLSNKANLQITIENFEKIGYNRLDGEGYRINSAGRRLSFKLLVNSENRSRVLAANEIVRSLKSAGIEIKIVERSYQSYLEDLASGSFQLYLGEINVLPNLDLTPLVLKGGSAAYGVGYEVIEANPENPDSTPISPTEKVMAEYYEGKVSISDVAGILLTELPQIPICYRKGLFFYDEKISNVKVSESDIYFNIEEYTS